MVKYVVYPGYVKSKTDGQRHWVSYQQLIALYHVDPKECINGSRPNTFVDRYIPLYPRYDGNYEIPKQK
jgi:hypothetical protein